eukprot:1136874-Pelagomonas_calceolata.AAC.6
MVPLLPECRHRKWCSKCPQDDCSGTKLGAGVQREPPYDTGPARFEAGHGVSCPAFCILVMSMQGATWGACMHDRPLATHIRRSGHTAAALCAQDALPHVLVQVCDWVGQVPQAAVGSRVLLPAGQTYATAAVSAAVRSCCLKYAIH